MTAKATGDVVAPRFLMLSVFGTDYAPLFLAANRRAAAAHGSVPGDRLPIPAENARQPSTPSPVASVAKCPKGSEALKMTVPMGHVRKESGPPAQAFDPNPKLEAAIARYEEGFRRSRGGSGTDSAK
jgi:hypothetical protein